MGSKSPKARVNQIEEMDRRTFHLWPDQARYLRDAEYEMRRRHRGHGGNIITASTLVRVAIDVLREAFPDLDGADEDDLRVFVGLAPRDLAPGDVHTDSSAAGEPVALVDPSLPVQRPDLPQVGSGLADWLASRRAAKRDV
jgi:hypothetical protein